MPPSRSVGAGEVTPSRAVVRIAPIEPQPQTDRPFLPFGRSGLDFQELLSTLDQVTPRAPSGNVALDVGLEQARSALLRNLPGDALAALDGVWDAANTTEEGWYLRSGALAVLGLPGESDRVAEDGLRQRPTSVALRFVQALSRLAVGDTSGASLTLMNALQRMPSHPTLLVMQALLLVRQRDHKGAQNILNRLQQVAPDHPALTWGRSAMRAAIADVNRQQSRPTPTDWPAGISETIGRLGTPPSSEATVDTIAMATPARIPTDVATGALERLGSRIAAGTNDEIAREARVLLRAFSAGGTLAATTSADHAHAARVILVAFAGVAAGEGTEHASPVRALIAQLLPMLQDQDFDGVERLMRKNSVLAREPVGRLLESIVRGAKESPREVPSDVFGNIRATPESSAAVSRACATPASGIGVVRDEPDRGPLVPIRLGLALVEETATMRKAMSGAHLAVGSGLAVGGLAIGTPRHGVEYVSGTLGRGMAMSGMEGRGEGWGAAHAASSHVNAPDWSDGAGVRAVALLCVVLAAVMLVTGNGVVAIALAVGAAWLGLRRSGRDGRRNNDRTSDGNSTR